MFATDQRCVEIRFHSVSNSIIGTVLNGQVSETITCNYFSFYGYSVELKVLYNTLKSECRRTVLHKMSIWIFFFFFCKYFLNFRFLVR